MPRVWKALDRAFPNDKEIFFVDRNQPDSIEKHLANIVQGDFERIVVVGGDGTLGRLVHGLCAHQLIDKYTLGLLPFGTCNDFARNLGLKSGRLNRALRALQKNVWRQVWVARVNGRYFINNAGFGKRAPAEQKKGSIRTIREMRPITVRIETEEEVVEGKFMMMLCANAPYFSGGLYFSRLSNPAHDWLDFYFIRKMARIRLLARLLVGRARLPLRMGQTSRSVFSMRSRKLSLYSEEPLWIVADGDPLSSAEGVCAAHFDIAESCRFIVSQ